MRDSSDEWLAWYRLTTRQRWVETQKLWAFYLSAGGSLDPESDTQSPLTLRSHGARYLLLVGGQICVFYGGAEFSRDTDITLLASPANLSRL